MILQQFYTKVKRKDGTENEPSTLANMQAALYCLLREASYMYSQLTSRHFLNSKGKHPNKSCGLSHDEIEQLWQSGQFGYHLPMALINTLWWSHGTPRTS